jgi:hypothetical protein
MKARRIIISLEADSTTPVTELRQVRQVRLVNARGKIVETLTLGEQLKANVIRGTKAGAAPGARKAK